MEGGMSIDLPPSPGNDRDHDVNGSDNSEPSEAFSLHRAVALGSVEDAEQLLWFGADVGLIDGRGRSAIHLAALNGHAPMITLLHAYDADVNAADYLSETALHMAARLGHEMAARVLLQCGADVNDETMPLQTALHLAVSHGHINIVTSLLIHGARLEAQDKDLVRPLHLAAFNGYTEILLLLLQAGAYINATTITLRTALHLAAHKGNPQMVALLLEHYANVNLLDKNERTPLHIAAKESHHEIASLLLRHMSHIDAVDLKLRTALHHAAISGNVDLASQLLNHSATVDYVDILSKTALHLAVESKHAEMVTLLLQRGANINAIDGNSQTALHLAVSTKYTRMVVLLLQHCADPKLPDVHKMTAFEIAVLQGDGEIVEKLLPYVGDINAKLSKKLPPLVEAVERGFTKIVRLLVANNANVELSNEDGCTPLLIAAENLQLDIASLLLEKKANMEVSNHHSMTALHWAATHGDVDFVHLLLKNGAKTEKTNRDGKTALFIATELNRQEVVSALVAHGACVNCKDSDGITAIHKATFLGHVEIVFILMRASATIEGTDDLIEALLDIASGAGHKNDVDTILSKLKASGSSADYVSSTLLKAAGYGRVDVVSLLLECGADIEIDDEYGRTPLFLAAKYPDLVAVLINRGASMEARSVRGYTPIHYYTALGHLKSLRLLLNMNCNIASLDDGSQTALHHAAKANDVKTTELLVNRGIDLDAWDCEGYTAVHLAIQRNYIDIVKVIVKKGFDIDASDYRISKRTVLTMAIELEREEIAEVLINHGANVKFTLGDQNSLPLHLAVLRFNPNLVSMILNAGADPNFVGYDGYSPLQSAIYQLLKEINHKNCPSKQSVLDVITLLLRAGADSSRLHIPRKIKSVYPEMANLFSTSIACTLSHQHYPPKLIPNIPHTHHLLDRNSLSEILFDAKTGCISVLGPSLIRDDSMNRYIGSFPVSKELRLDTFAEVKEYGNVLDIDPPSMSKGFRLTHSMSMDDRATRIIMSLVRGIGATFHVNDNFFTVNVPGMNNYIAPKWALPFNNMRGLVHHPSLLIVQVPQKRTELSVPGWYMNKNPVLRFIDAVYACRRSIPDHHDTDLYSDVLGGMEKRLAVNLHATLIAGIFIVSVAEEPQRIEKLVNAILGLKVDLNRDQVSSIPPTDWQILNRIRCGCESQFPHRPLTPVAAAKAVGIPIWRNLERETVTRAWDLVNDNLVNNIDIRKVTFMTHKWAGHEEVYKPSLNQISMKSSKLQHIRDALRSHTRYVWLDTICIDKTNFSELDQTIRSMYNWYSNCQAVVLDSGTPLEDWCKRGWCLQEGSAAGILYGISKDDKLMSIQELAKEQNVNLCSLDLHLYYRHGNAAEILARMDVRETTRKEDMAYALAGIFQIHLTASYGEGTEARGRLLHELAIQKGDLSFLSFPTVDNNALNYLPNPTDANFLIAACTDTSTPTNVSHCGICIEVQLVQGAGVKMVLEMLGRWKDLKIFQGKSSGIPELIATAERPEYRNSTDVELAIIHDIRSIMLIQSYGEDIHTGGNRPIKLCFRLQCCQIEEDEFERLFYDLDIAPDRIWLGRKPTNGRISRFQQKRKRRSTIEDQQVFTLQEPDSEGSNVTDDDLAAKRLKISLHEFLVDNCDNFEDE
ncbi:unnamed protein product [Umbelopsis ramanniana]